MTVYACSILKEAYVCGAHCRAFQTMHDMDIVQANPKIVSLNGIPHKILNAWAAPTGEPYQRPWDQSSSWQHMVLCTPRYMLIFVAEEIMDEHEQLDCLCSDELVRFNDVSFPAQCLGPVFEAWDDWWTNTGGTALGPKTEEFLRLARHPISDGERMVKAIEGADGKRLYYRKPVDKTT